MLFTAILTLACGAKSEQEPVASDGGAADAAAEVMPLGVSISVDGTALALNEMPFATSPSSGLSIQSGIVGDTQSLIVINVAGQPGIDTPVECSGPDGDVWIWLTGGGYDHDNSQGSCTVTFTEIGYRSGEQTSGSFSATLHPVQASGNPPLINHAVTLSDGSFKALVP
jgi:hypothetical protein